MSIGVFPCTVFSVERQFREDLRGAIAAFVSGGTDGASLPLGFVFDGYGQAGFVGGKGGGGGFADIQLKPQRPLFIEEPVKINAGVGVSKSRATCGQTMARQSPCPPVSKR